MENHFYDVIPEDVFPESVVNWFREQGATSNHEKSQGIENGLAELVEKDFSEKLRGIIEKAQAATPWHINNCVFLSPEQKGELAAYLAIQFIRTKSIRRGFQDAADCLNQSLIDMGAPSAMIEEYLVSQTEAKNMHIRTMLDVEYLTQVAMGFLRLTWILGINRTPVKLYTSDDPITAIAHLYHPAMPMNGICSKGVEVIFPLTPNLVLIMIDGEYHTSLLSYERRYMVIDEERLIESYNSEMALHADRVVISSDGNYELLKKMKSKQPDVFKQPHVCLSYGGKVYLPRGD